MEVLCDTLIVEEILPRLLPKDLLHLRAASRRYNALALRPEFIARYWQRAGIFVQPQEWSTEIVIPVFLTGNPTDLIMPGADLAFLPGPSADEEATMKHFDENPEAIDVLHSAAGLLLCCRGGNRPLRYYVCNPLTCQYVALPNLPASSPVDQYLCGILTLTAGTKSFQVTIVHRPKLQKTCLNLSVFSSDTGQWELRKLPVPRDIYDDDTLEVAPMISLSGISYWISSSEQDEGIAYNSSSSVYDFIQRVALPPRLVHGEFNRCIGERHGGGLQYAQSNMMVFEVWLSDIIGGKWRRWVKVSVARIVERNPQAADFLTIKYHSGYGPFTPVGFHPTDEDVVFVALPGAVFAYSIEHGTMNLQCTHDYLAVPNDVHPYVHLPASPVQIPAIKDPSIQESKRWRPCI